MDSLTQIALGAAVGEAALGKQLERGWAAEGFATERTMSNPMPLNTVLWMGIADTGDSLRVGLYSLLDHGPPERFLTIPQRPELVEPVAHERAVRRVIRFSKGWYAAHMRRDTLVIDDLRFGRGDAWLSNEGDPIFRFVMLPGDCPDTWCSFRQERPELRSVDAVSKRLDGGPPAGGSYR